MAASKKKTKKGNGRLNAGPGLTLVQTYDITTSLYGKKSKKPLFSYTARGDHRISVLKLVLILLAVISALTAVILTLRALIENRRRRYILKEASAYDDLILKYEEDGELPF